MSNIPLFWNIEYNNIHIENFFFEMLSLGIWKFSCSIEQN